jgi:hypothetical protein
MSLIKPHPDLQNGVSPNIVFYKYPFESLSAGSSGGIAINSATAASYHASGSFLTNHVPLSAISLTSDDGYGDSISGYYGSYLNNDYKKVSYAARNIPAASAGLNINQIGYFKWDSHVLDSAADAMSGVMALGHINTTDFYSAGDLAVSGGSQNYVTVTAHIWNIDDEGDGGTYDYNMTSSDVVLYVDGLPYPMLMASATPAGLFKAYSYFYKTFAISDFTIDKHYYWVKTTETWAGKSEFSGSGWFNVTDGTFDVDSSSAASGDYTGSTRGDALTGHHSVIAKSSYHTTDSYKWQNIFTINW